MDCKNVKELFFECDLDKLNDMMILYFVGEKDIFEERRLEYRDKLCEIMANIKEIEPVKSDNILLAGDGYISSKSYFFSDEYLKESSREDYDDEDECEGRLHHLDVVMAEPDNDEVYSIMGCEWKDILGYQVPEFLIERIGLEYLMISILWEMTWFGLTAEEVHESISETIESINPPNMSILVTSASGALDYVMKHLPDPGFTEYPEKTDTYVAISIQDTCDGGFGFELKKSKYCKDVLTLYFDDIEEPVEGLCLMTQEQADAIFGFIIKYCGKVDTLLIHCFAGLSRSMAVGVFASDVLRIKNYEHNVHYNKYVYEMLHGVREKLLKMSNMGC